MGHTASNRNERQRNEECGLNKVTSPLQEQQYLNSKRLAKSDCLIKAKPFDSVGSCERKVISAQCHAREESENFRSTGKRRE